MKNKAQKSIYIVIPAFNEEKAIGKVIKDIQKQGFNQIIVIDDGSFDNTRETVESLNCISLRHIINRGKGAATQTGLDAAELLGADIVVTMDADGQHVAGDIKKLVEPILDKKCDVTLGSRLLESEGMPLSRKIINFFGNLITYFFYGIYVSDSQSGFRAYSKKAIQFIDTKMDRYEFESEILQQVKDAKLKFIEVPIDVKYTEYSKNKWDGIKDFPRQRFLNGFKMLYRMIVRSILS